MLTHLYCTVVTVVGMICQSYNVLCSSGGFSARYADVYLEAIDFVSIRYVNLTLDCFMLINFQHCSIWFDLVLWPDEGRACREPPSCQVSINQAHRNVHILPVVYRMSYILRTALLLVACVCEV
jgi:hypothetical protein